MALDLSAPDKSWPHASPTSKMRVAATTMPDWCRDFEPNVQPYLGSPGEQGGRAASPEEHEDPRPDDPDAHRAQREKWGERGTEAMLVGELVKAETEMDLFDAEDVERFDEFVGNRMKHLQQLGVLSDEDEDEDEDEDADAGAPLDAELERRLSALRDHDATADEAADAATIEKMMAIQASEAPPMKPAPAAAPAQASDESDSQIDWEALSRIGPSGEAAEAVLADLLGVSRSASYAVGEIVVMTGLREVEFNGSIGRVVSVDRADNRYTVDVDGGPLSVRGQNLQSATLVHDLSAPPRRREYDDGTD
jgi:hypothetical protein|eukprot:COSAG06_NODE_2830_length_6206_cov_5.616014_4_plen_308_part_00